MKIAKEVEELLSDAVLNAGRRGNEYVTPEHVWFVLADRPAFQAAFKSCGGDVKKLKSRLEDYLGQMDTVEKDEGGIEVSYGLSQTIEEAARKAISSDRDTIELPQHDGAGGELRRVFCSDAGRGMRGPSGGTGHRWFREKDGGWSGQNRRNRQSCRNRRNL